METPVRAASANFVNQPSVDHQEVIFEDKGIIFKIPRNYIVSFTTSTDNRPILEIATMFPGFSGVSSPADLKIFNEKSWWDVSDLIVLRGPATADEGFTNHGLMQVAKDLHVEGLGQREVQFPFMGKGYVIVSPFQNEHDAEILVCLNFERVTRCRGYIGMTPNIVFMYEYDSSLINYKEDISHGVRVLLKTFLENK